MKKNEVAKGVIEYLRKYKGRGLINPSVFSQALGCTRTELRRAQITLLRNNVVTCVSDKGVPEYLLSEAHMKGDEWQFFFPEIKEEEVVTDKRKRKDIAGKIVELLQGAGGKFKTTTTALAIKCGDGTSQGVSHALKSLRKKGIIQPFTFFHGHREGSEISLVEKFLSGDSWRTKFAKRRIKNSKGRQCGILKIKKESASTQLNLHPLAFELNKALLKLDETQKIAIDSAKEAMHWKSEAEKWKAEATTLQTLVDEAEQQIKENAQITASNKDLLSRTNANEEKLKSLTASS